MISFILESAWWALIAALVLVGAFAWARDRWPWRKPPRKIEDTLRGIFQTLDDEEQADLAAHGVPLWKPDPKRLRAMESSSAAQPPRHRDPS